MRELTLFFSGVRYEEDQCVICSWELLSITANATSNVANRTMCTINSIFGKFAQLLSTLIEREGEEEGKGEGDQTDCKDLAAAL